MGTKRDIKALQASNKSLGSQFESLAESVNALTAILTAQATAKQVTPPVAVTSSRRTAPATGAKVYRSAKGKEAAKVEVAAAWEAAKKKAGVTRVKDLSPKQRALVDAQVKAIWAAVPKTRTTKA